MYVLSIWRSDFILSRFAQNKQYNDNKHTGTHELRLFPSFLSRLLFLHLFLDSNPSIPPSHQGMHTESPIPFLYHDPSPLSTSNKKYYLLFYFYLATLLILLLPLDYFFMISKYKFCIYETEIWSDVGMSYGRKKKKKEKRKKKEKLNFRRNIYLFFVFNFYKLLINYWHEDTQEYKNARDICNIRESLVFNNIINVYLCVNAIRTNTISPATLFSFVGIKNLYTLSQI